MTNPEDQFAETMDDLSEIAMSEGWPGPWVKTFLIAFGLWVLFVAWITFVSLPGAPLVVSVA